MLTSCGLLLTTLALARGFMVQTANEPQPIWNETWTDKLKKDLFVKYDRFARPTQHFNNITVKFDITILHVKVDEFQSTVIVNGWARHEWIDEKLMWDSAKYGNLESVHVGNHEIWQPDIVLYNSGTPNTVEHYGDTNCIVSHEGKVIWVPPAHYIALCDLDLRYWPFDTQVCNLRLGSWTFSEEHIDLQLAAEDFQHDLVIRNSEWELVSVNRTRTSKLYTCCVAAYVHVDFELTLKRNSALYYNTIWKPAASVIVLTLATFWLPAQSEMKVMVAACTSLIISVFLAYIGLKVPVTTAPPLIVYFYTGCLCLVTISLIFALFVINMSRRPYCKPLPRNIRMMLLSWPGKLLGLCDLIRVIESRKPMAGQELRGKPTEEFSTNSTTNIAEDCDRQNIISSSKNTSQLEWILAGTAVDRIVSLIFCIVLVTMTIAYLP